LRAKFLVAGLIAKVANDSKDPLRFLSDFRDEIHAVVRQVRIAGSLDTGSGAAHRGEDRGRAVFSDEAAEHGLR
jgi:hypothetical protein